MAQKSTVMVDKQMLREHLEALDALVESGLNPVFAATHLMVRSGYNAVYTFVPKGTDDPDAVVEAFSFASSKENLHAAALTLLTIDQKPV